MSGRHIEPGTRTDDRLTAPPAQADGLGSVLQENIQALQLRRQREEVEATLEERIAQAITRFTGSMPFVYLHLAFFGFWIVANLGWIPGVARKSVVRERGCPYV